jgi:hypothetical protein
MPKTTAFSHRTGLLLLPVLALVLALALSSFAVDGRDFAGFYAVSNVSDMGDKVQLRMSVQLSNFSAGDLQSPVVALMNSGPANTAPIGSFPAPKQLKAGRDVILHQQFTVSKEEFRQWDMRGRGPRVVVLFRDSTGGVVERGVQISRRPALPESVN